ncbi:MAG: hypothetical protein VX929_14450 [Pseudomonadota bacterium]|nr:hypothetical protein [Pseudomonadota bacterium]
MNKIANFITTAIFVLFCASVFIVADNIAAHLKDYVEQPVVLSDNGTASAKRDGYGVGSHFVSDAA